MVSKSEYTKKLSLKLDIKPELSSKEIKNIKDEIKNLSALKFMDKDSKKFFGKEMTEYMKAMKSIEELNQAIDELSKIKKVPGAKDNIKELTKQRDKIQKQADKQFGTSGEEKETVWDKTKEIGNALKDSSMMKGISQVMGNTFTVMTGISSIVSTISNYVKEALETLTEIADYSGSSYKISTQAVDWLTNYGLSGAEAYAWQQVLDEEGFSSLDQLLEYMPFMTEKQLEYMQYIYDTAIENYDTAQEIAAAYADFQLSWEQFQDAVVNQLVAFFAENKDTIEDLFDLIILFAQTGLDIAMPCLQIIANLLELIYPVIEIVADVVTAILGWVADILSWLVGSSSTEEADTEQAALDILGLTSTSSSITYNITYDNSSVSVDTSFTGVSRQDQEWLSESYSLANSQIIKYLDEN